MVELVQLYKTLNFGHKAQVIRTLVLIPTIVSLLAWYFTMSPQVRFYLEVWMGASMVVVIALLLVEVAYEVKICDD